METDYLDNVSSSSEDDDDEVYTDSSDEINSDFEMSRNQNNAAMETTDEEAHKGPNNIVLKLMNKERFGNIRGYKKHAHHVKQDLFSKVPNRLQFRLKSILPPLGSAGHIFMGLTACGQFLLSYKMIPKENVPYSFNMGLMYSLYFWVYQPHKRLNEFYKCCLFDDHGVDNIKEVTITQWKNCDPRILVVHGASSDEGEDSYITYVKVPKLGCSDCKNLRESEQLESFVSQFNPLCLNCNLTIHTKYPFVEADRKFDPFTNLICPNRILLVANGFMHMLKIEIENNANTPTANQNANCYMQYSNTASNNHPLAFLKSPQQFSSHNVERRQSQLSISTDDILPYDNCNNVVARIQADFSDIETASTTSNDSRHNDYNKYQISSSCSPAPPTNNTPSNESQQFSSRGAVLISPHNKHKQRIVTKSFRNGVITVDMQGLPSTSTGIGSSLNDKSSAYDFSEDNEKCEKIATLRKRRLADKKYEFSEDNSENIVPFTKIRSANRSFSGNCFGGSPNGLSGRTMHRPTTSANTFHKSPCASPSSSPHTSLESRLYAQPATLQNTQSVSPITTSIPQGFRSPQSCGSPVSVANFYIRSPKRQPAAVGPIANQKSPPVTATSSPLTLSAHAQQLLSFKPLGALSPLQVSSTKLNQLEMSGMSPNAHTVEIPTQPGQVPEKPVCTKKLQRRYIEEDDAASVITSEEDDCISPGYHTSLPLEVHGSWYSEMHMISQASYQQLRCPSVIITQHSFDFETFTYYAISILCQKNQKTYDVFYDWAYDVISVCPVSNTVFCVLLAQFSARDQLPSGQTICLNCSHKLDCAFHRHYFESRILFTWEMETAEWDVLDYGELKECKNAGVFTVIKRCNQKQPTLIQQVKKIVKEMSTNLKKLLPHYADNLRVLDSNIKKSKTTLCDLDNMVEFHLRKPRNA